MSGLEYDWYHPRIRFVSVPRSSLDIQGPFEHEMRSLAAIAAARSGKALPNDLSSVLMPVHELQIPNVANKFHDLKILDSDISVKALAQSSIRYVMVTPCLVSTTQMTTQNRHCPRTPWNCSQVGCRR
jgi:hypothetical protein